MPFSRLLRGPWRSITLAALAFLIGSATVVVATGSIPGPDGRIQACYNQQNGNLRVVMSPADCRNTEIAIAWSQSGAQGTQGLQGIQGLKGDPGPTGPTGPTGPAGADGASGAPGTPGASGAPGASGVPGASGAPGTTLTALSQLAGLACTHNGATGTTSLTFDATGQAKLTCIVGPTPTPGTAVLAVSPTSFAFDTRAIGGSPAFAQFNVTNTGGSRSGLVTFGGPDEPFQVGGDTTCLSYLDPGQTCALIIEFAPTAEGSFTDEVAVAAGPGVTVTVQLTGSGVTALNLHSNGVNGTYLHASLPGTPGDANTYSESMARAAAGSANLGPWTAGTCGGDSAIFVRVQPFGTTLIYFYYWMYSGPTAGRVASFSTQSPGCPGFLDATWN